MCSTGGIVMTCTRGSRAKSGRGLLYSIGPWVDEEWCTVYGIELVGMIHFTWARVANDTKYRSQSAKWDTVQEPEWGLIHSTEARVGGDWYTVQEPEWMRTDTKYRIQSGWGRHKVQDPEWVGTDTKYRIQWMRTNTQYINQSGWGLIYSRGARVRNNAQYISQCG